MIPRRTETSNASRVFWMPDQSCRVCYECDLPFTIFNRRHHCRICGRVFCGRCTVNTFPAAFAEGRKYEQEDRERIRVCIFCFKQWEQETIPAQCNGLQSLSPGISPSLSCTSLVSSESSGNSSSNSTNSSSIRSVMPHSTVPYQHITYSSCLNAVEANGLEQGRNTDNTNLVSTLESEGPAASAFGIPTNRSDDEDDEYSELFEDSEWRISRKLGENYHDCSINCPSVYSFNKANSVDLSCKISMDQAFLSKTQISGEQCIEGKTPGLSQTGARGTENQFSVMRERSGEESESTDNGDECNDESPMFEATSPESEQPMDIENNGIIWIPPEPEDEEDEKETSVFDDDDDYDGGGWALPRSTGSFTDSKCKSKDRVSEEHRKAMKTVVDGHLRALVAQLLKGEDVPVGEENDKESWLEIVTSLSWQAASLVKPDTSKGGGGMDPGGYVKVKCLACGHPFQRLGCQLSFIGHNIY